MSLIARLFRFIFISFIVGGGLLMFYPAICHLISSGLIYEPVFAGLITATVGLVGFAFVEVFMNDEEFMWMPTFPLPGDEDE